MKYNKIHRCRLCYSNKLKPLIDFGSICLSSAFPYKSLKYKKIISDDFFDLERLHEHISPDMCIDQDWPSGKTTISLLFFNQDISNVYDNFIYSIYEILGYDFYFQKKTPLRSEIAKTKTV